MEDTAVHTVLITGYSGLIGQYISTYLSQKGFIVKGLTQNKKQLSESVFYWNVNEQLIDKRALENVDCIIHLAGLNIAGKRWTSKRKKDIIDSRVNSSLFLARVLKETNIKLKALIGTSATGYYGSITSQKIFREEDDAGMDFLGECCLLWEKSYHAFNEIADRIVILRLPTVLSKNDGALQKIVPIVKRGLASPLGSGNQYMPLVCMNDLMNLYEFILSNPQLAGIYNANAPCHVTNKQLMVGMASVLHKPFIMPAVPTFFLKVIYGEFASVLIEGSRVSSSKLIDSGFKFSHATLESMLKSVL
jgi:uncharacterized protein